MARESVVYGSSLLLITVGLIALVYGEYAHIRSIMPIGGISALIGVSVITGSIFRL